MFIVFWLSRNDLLTLTGIHRVFFSELKSMPGRWYAGFSTRPMGMFLSLEFSFSRFNKSAIETTADLFLLCDFNFSRRWICKETNYRAEPCNVCITLKKSLRRTSVCCLKIMCCRWLINIESFQMKINFLRIMGWSHWSRNQVLMLASWRSAKIIRFVQKSTVHVQH